MKAAALRHLDALITGNPTLFDIRDHILRAAQMIWETYESGGKLLVCGNGGSAADSDHIVGELMKSFMLPRKLQAQDIEKLRAAGLDDWEELSQMLQRGIPAISLVGSPALASAIANDTDPSMIYAQQVYVLGRPGDVLIALSTSGTSPNVCKAIRVARAFGLKTILFTGNRRSIMDTVCDVTIKAPYNETYRVQECHLPIYHTICLMVEEESFGR